MVGHRDRTNDIGATAEGQYLNLLNLVENLPGAQAVHIWDTASLSFTAGTSGRVNVFNKGATQLGPFGERTWRLKKLAPQNNSGVTNIRQWNWAMNLDGLP